MEFHAERVLSILESEKPSILFMSMVTTTKLGLSKNSTGVGSYTITTVCSNLDFGT
jgi:hypothetical protein